MSFSTSSCKDDSSAHRTSFKFTVEHVFYIKPPVDRVILVGTVDDGLVQAGAAATVECRSNRVEVVVEGIETPQGDIERATRGQQVGLRLSGIKKDQPSVGDRVAGRSG